MTLYPFKNTGTNLWTAHMLMDEKIYQPFVIIRLRMRRKLINHFIIKPARTYVICFNFSLHYYDVHPITTLYLDGP